MPHIKNLTEDSFIKWQFREALKEQEKRVEHLAQATVGKKEPEATVRRKTMTIPRPEEVAVLVCYEL